MKKSLLAASVALSLGAIAPSANAAFTAMADGAYTMYITGGCFGFENCQSTGNGTFTDNATANQATFSGFGSGIVGDGYMGVIDFTITGGSISVNSYSQDSYQGTAGGTFYLQDQDSGDGNSNGSLMGMTVDSVSGAMTFDPTGRDGIAASYAGSLGLQEWNRDNTSDGLGSDVYTTFTSGSMTNRAQGFSAAFTVNGTDLTDDGTGGWTGTLASAGNIGQGWGDFNNQQYAEIFDVKIVSAVPVPAAVWLFGSGLLGLVGVARRRKQA